MYIYICDKRTVSYVKVTSWLANFVIFILLKVRIKFLHGVITVVFCSFGLNVASKIGS